MVPRAAAGGRIAAAGATEDAVVAVAVAVTVALVAVVVVPVVA